jgi:dephospho-CoA kinase
MRSSRGYLLVGVTGGIGSGKSTVCRAFAKLGRQVISADLIARSLTETDPMIRTKITQTFGAAIYRSNGSLDRKKLAAQVFADMRLREQLDAIVHPEVFRDLERRLNGLAKARRRPYVVIEAALVYESGFDKGLDRVVVVTADEESRIVRVMQRDGCSREEVLRRINSQMPAGQKASKGDYIIVNEQNSTLLESKVQFIDALLKLEMRQAEGRPGDQRGAHGGN